MGIGDFFVNIKGKNEQLNNVKHGVRKDQVDKKYHNLFDAYDTNQDGTLEANELEGIFKGLQNFAGSDRVLDSSENAQVKSIFAEQANIQDADFQGFVKSVSDASAEIVSTTETKTSDGGKEITTTYSDGTIETIGYYSDGDYKFRRTEAHQETTQTNYTINGNTNKLYSVAELKQNINSAYKQHKKDIEAKNKQNAKLDSARTYFVWPFDTFAQNYISKNNILPFTTINKTYKLDIELSERGKKDAAVREFVLTHYIETHKAAKEALDSMGLLDDTGALINAGAGIAWNKIKNVWNGTEEEYQDFYSLKDKFEPNYDKALKMEGTLKVVQNNPEGYFRGEVGNIDTEKGAKFQEKTEQYQNAMILNTRINLLKEAISEIRMFQSEQGIQSFTPTQGEGLNPSSHILNAKNLLLQCVGGDQEAVDMLLDGTVGNAYATLKRIQEILNDTEKLNKTILNGQSFDEIQNEYKSQYKEMYGTDFVPDELTEKVMDAKATGGMVKLAAITIVSIIVTRSPIMAQINGAIVGSAEATGAVANLMRTLVTKYGQAAVAQGIRFAMTSGTLATDVGLTLLNQVTSEHGVDGEELWESTKSSAKYIYFGSYIGGPLAQVVSKQLGKIGVASKMFEGGAKVTTGGVQTTTITGDKLVQNLMKGGNKVLTKGGAFLTDVAAFTGLEVVTEGQDIATAGKEQLEFLPKLKIMNHLIECMLGGKVHAGMHKVKMDAAIEQSGVKNWEIKEIKTPSKTMYEVKVQDGLPLVRFEDKNKLITAMLEVVASKYEKLIDAKGAQKVSDKENVKIDADGEITANNTSSKSTTKINESQNFEVERVGTYQNECGTLVLKNSSGEQVGIVNYDIRESNGQKVLHFEGLKSDISGAGVGSQLIQELVKLSKELGAEGRLIATASPMLSTDGKLTNLGFYYKLGFKATDATKDAEIRKLLAEGKEIPLSLNIFTDIELTPESIVKNTLTKKQNLLYKLDNAKNREDFVAIHDEIKNLPLGKQRDELMQEYIKKYNEWVAELVRSNIKMQYKPETSHFEFYATLEELRSENGINGVKISSKYCSMLRHKGIAIIDNEKEIIKIENANDKYRVCVQKKEIKPSEITLEKAIAHESALVAYCFSPIYKEINKSTEVRDVAPEIKEIVDNLEELIDLQPRMQKLENKVYRKEYSLWIVEEIQKILNGKNIEDITPDDNIKIIQPHFLSTSKINNGGFAIAKDSDIKVKYELDVEAGCKAIDIIDYFGTDYFAENESFAYKVIQDRELLFQKGTVIKIFSVEKDSNGCLIIKGTLSPY